MAIGIVQEVKFNVQKESKAGKKYTVTQLVFVTEAGQKKTESCFSDCEYKDVLKGLAPGDKIDAKYTKNGEYFNLVDVKLVEKGTGEVPKFGGSGAAKSGGGSFQKDPETQAAIIRQNALTNAVHFMTSEAVVATLKGDKSKLSADVLADMTLNFARKFEGYTSGKDVTKSLTDAVQSVPTPPNSDEIPE